MSEEEDGLVLDITNADDNAQKENAEGSRLENLTVMDIVKKSYNEEIITSDIVPFENVRNNSKVFLIYYAKMLLSRVLKLTEQLGRLEDRLMLTVDTSPFVDPEVILQTASTIQNSLNAAVALIDKISTNDNYVKLIYNDNRQQIIDNSISNSLISTNVQLSRESRDKVRRVAEKLLESLSQESS